MKRLAKKTAKILVVTAVSVVFIALVAVYFSINSIVKDQIIAFGEKELNAQVNLSSAHVSLFPVGVTLSKLELINNSTSEPWRRFAAKTIKTSVDHTTLFQDTIVINYVLVNQPHVTYDIEGLGFGDVAGKVSKEVATGMLGTALLGPVGAGIGVVGMGVKALKKNLDEKKEEKEEAIKKALESKEEGKKFIINKVYINDGKFVPADNVLWLGEGKEVDIPNIELEYVGDKSSKVVLQNVQAMIKTAVIQRLTSLNLKESD